ncbi:MAG: mechanosensitive ion channel [Geminicoccales bacterium]
MERFLSSLQSTLGQHIPGILGAILILLVGWVLAVLARASVKKGLSLLAVNSRISETAQERMDVEKGIAVGVFWLVMLITLIGVLNTLNLDVVSDPFKEMLRQVLAYLPRLIAGGLLLLLGWVLAMALRAGVGKALASTDWDKRISAQAGMEPMSKTLGNVLFWLTILLFVPAILGALDLEGLLQPVRGMIDKALAMIPNIFAALAIGFVGWLIAKVLRGLVTNLLAAAGADKVGGSVGLGEEVRISRLVGMIVFILVFIPALIAALDALRVAAISQPAVDMLRLILEAVPNILAAAVILVITWYVARFASDILGRLLAGVGLDALPQKIGAKDAFKETRPSVIVGRIVLFFAMLFATVEAANRLGFGQVRDVVTLFIKFGADVLLGAAILAIGFWLANLAYKAIDKASGAGSAGLAGVARLAILGLVIAMGLRAMGIANDIVNLAFGLTLGAVAVAVALSFGLGGREAAGKQMEHWLAKWRK